MNKNLYDTLAYYNNSLAFREWQNELAQKLYAVLQNNLRANEVTTVTELCNALNNERYGGISITTNKIHGKKSYVDFDYKGAMKKKELADMVIISLITNNRELLFSKVALVQNKKWNTPMTWDIDQEQLYLLMNFPTFSGLSSKIGTVQDNVFLNHSGTLGNYGLFSDDGELVLATAKSVFCQQANRKVKFDDIKKYADYSPLTVNFPFFYGSQFTEELYYLYKRCGIFLLHSAIPFCNKYNVALNMHEFVRNLTWFNIGEPSMAFGRACDNNLQNFSERILYAAFGDTGENLSFQTSRWDEGIENEFFVIRMQIELKEQ